MKGSVRMAKDKFIEGRNEGMAFALKLVKEKGIEGLEHEVKLRGLTFMPSRVTETQIKEICLRLKEDMLYKCMVLAVSALHDEFEYGAKRCTKLVDKMLKIAEAMGDDYCTMSDYVQMLEEELGIVIDIKE